MWWLNELQKGCGPWKTARSGGIRQRARTRKREYLEGDRGEEMAVIGRAMRWR